MNILVLGAAGKTGQEIVKQALEHGDQVTAFVRDVTKLTISHRKLIVFQGDARSQEDLLKALKGQDVVVSALGTVKGGDALFSRSAESLAKAAKSAGVKRVILMSSFIITPNLKRNILMKLAEKMMKGMIDDMKAGERKLQASHLDWTFVYATALTNGPKTGLQRVVGDDEKVGMNNKISRADVADFLLRQINDKTSVRTTRVITQQ
jgi:putative NADH-flavin reductase